MMKKLQTTRKKPKKEVSSARAEKTRWSRWGKEEKTKLKRLPPSEKEYRARRKVLITNYCTIEN